MYSQEHGYLYSCFHFPAQEDRLLLANEQEAQPD